MKKLFDWFLYDTNVGEEWVELTNDQEKKILDYPMLLGPNSQDYCRWCSHRVNRKCESTFYALLFWPIAVTSFSNVWPDINLHPSKYILPYIFFENHIFRSASVSFRGIDDSQESRGKERIISYLPTAHEHSEIYLQFLRDDCFVFLIAASVITTLLHSKNYSPLYISMWSTVNYIFQAKLGDGP